MKILSITASLELIALKTPFITALRRVENIEFVRVVVTCENGMQSIGEAPATKAITNEDTYDIMNSVWKVEKYLINQTLKDSLSILHKNTEIGSSAKAALDMAIVSLQAQQEKQKIFEFLGAKKAIELQTDITISYKKPHEMIEDSRVAINNGMNILKVKLADDIKHAIEVTKSIASIFKEAVLIIDANQAWSVANTLEYIHAMQDVKIELIEQPSLATDISALREITQKSHIPILADESVFTLEDAKRVVESNSANMINIKLMKCGGITKAVEILEYAREKNIPCMLGSMLEGPYSINAALHLAIAYNDIIHYIDLDSPLLYKEASNDLEFSFNQNRITFKG